MGVGLSWLSRASFWVGIGRSVTDETVCEMEVASSSSILVGVAIVVWQSPWKEDERNLDCRNAEVEGGLSSEVTAEGLG